jgi:hypothetical protein
MIIAYNKSFGTSLWGDMLNLSMSSFWLHMLLKVYAIESIGVHNQWLMKVVGHVCNLLEDAQKYILFFFGRKTPL